LDLKHCIFLSLFAIPLDAVAEQPAYDWLNQDHACRTEIAREISVTEGIVSEIKKQILDSFVVSMKSCSTLSDELMRKTEKDVELSKREYERLDSCLNHPQNAQDPFRSEMKGATLVTQSPWRSSTDWQLWEPEPFDPKQRIPVEYEFFVFDGPRNLELVLLPNGVAEISWYPELLVGKATRAVIRAQCNNAEALWPQAD